MSRHSAEVKLPARLVEQVDGYARAVKKQSGVDVSRQQAAHALLKIGLRAIQTSKFTDPLQAVAAAARDAEERKRR